MVPSPLMSPMMTGSTTGNAAKPLSAVADTRDSNTLSWLVYVPVPVAFPRKCTTCTASSPTTLIDPLLSDTLLKCNSAFDLYAALAGTVAVWPPSVTAPELNGVGLKNATVACADAPDPEVV